jgi:hypothetical protein
MRAMIFGQRVRPIDVCEFFQVMNRGGRDTAAPRRPALLPAAQQQPLLEPAVALIPHHETFSATIQPPHSSTKGWIMCPPVAPAFGQPSIAKGTPAARPPLRTARRACLRAGGF